MMNVVYIMIGRLSLCFDLLRRLLGARRRWEPDSISSNDLDMTGRIFDDIMTLQNVFEDCDVLVRLYPNLGHSLWRAQEWSLFRNHWSLLSPPVMDFGCGDGSFASGLSNNIEYGVDIDEAALSVARKKGVYGKLLRSEQNKIPLSNNMIKSVFSNSVLEHIVDLENVLRDINRILLPNGRLIFTVPVKQYERDLAFYFGKSTARRVNMEAFHRNLYEPVHWEKVLSNTGFIIEKIVSYQPLRFTFWYYMCRLLGKHGLTMFVPKINKLVWEKFQLFWVQMIRDSINNTKNGGNVLIVARKVK